MRQAILITLVIASAIAVMEGLWALDFVVSYGGCTTYLPGYWQVPTDGGTCANLRYWSITMATIFLASVAIYGIMHPRCGINRSLGSRLDGDGKGRADKHMARCRCDFYDSGDGNMAEDMVDTIAGDT